MARDLIDAYLARLRAGLPDSRAAARILDEVADGLRTATEDHVLRGVEPARAAELAVAEFGEPGELAADFTTVLATAQAHRDALALLVTGPAIGGLWLASALLTWPAAPAAVGIGAVAAGVALATTVPRLVHGVAATGRLGRRLRTPPAAAVRTVSAAARTVVALDAALVVLALPVVVLFSPSAPAAALAAAAALLSLGRLVAAARVTRRLERFRARPTSTPTVTP